MYFTIVSDDEWGGVDLSKTPYSICIWNIVKKTKLYTTLLYQFSTREDAMSFCDKVINDNVVDTLEKELTEHKNRLDKQFADKVQREINPFLHDLKIAGITYKQLLLLRQKYEKLPTYLKGYLRENCEQL